MRGEIEVEGALLGEPVQETGSGFFETWLRAGIAAPSDRDEEEGRR